MYRYLWFLDYLRKAYYTCSSKSVVFTTKRGKMKKQIEILKDTPLFFGVQEHENRGNAWLPVLFGKDL